MSFEDKFGTFSTDTEYSYVLQHNLMALIIEHILTFEVSSKHFLNNPLGSLNEFLYQWSVDI